MNLFALSGLLVGISFALMGGLVYVVNPSGSTNRMWGLLCTAVGTWGFGAFLVGMTQEPAAALTWWKVAHAGVACIPALFYHFVTIFTGRRRSGRVLAIYALSAIFLAFSFTSHFVADLRLVFGEFYYDAYPTPIYSAFVAFFAAVAALALVELWQYMRRLQPGVRRFHAQWLLLGAGVGFAAGATCFLPVFGIDVYPYGNFALLLFPLLMGYAVLRYRIMDMKLALARTVAFILIYGVVIGLPFISAHWYRGLWELALGSLWWAGPVLMMGFLASLGPSIYFWIQQRAEAKILGDRHDYQKILWQASQGMTQVRELKQLLRLTVYVVTKTVGLTHAAVFLEDMTEDDYALSAFRYRQFVQGHERVAKDDPLIVYLTTEQEPVVLDRLKAEMGVVLQDVLVNQRAEVARRMEALRARVIVPSFMQGRLIGFLALGEKRSGAPFTHEDMIVFSTLANQAAMAIENARFFEELKTSEAHMIQSEKMASLGQLASGMAHEIHNPLAIISGEAQLYLERFKGKDGETDKVLASIVEECRRAADITRRILRFAKPGKPDFVPVDMKALLSDTMQLAAYQVKLDNIQQTVEVPENLPKVLGHQNQLQEVVLNLVINACHAMSDKGGRLNLSACSLGDKVELKIGDTGPGIPREKLVRLFDPFFTTKANGTGLGLFVSHRIIKSHNGMIDVKSVAGQGTTFTIHLPVCPDQPAPATAS